MSCGRCEKFDGRQSCGLRFALEGAVRPDLCLLLVVQDFLVEFCWVGRARSSVSAEVGEG